jgi:hypothetical protein
MTILWHSYSHIIYIYFIVAKIALIKSQIYSIDESQIYTWEKWVLLLSFSLISSDETVYLLLVLILNLVNARRMVRQDHLVRISNAHVSAT